MPLSEEEQRILHEMEQTLRVDRDFVARVDHHTNRLDAAKGARWSLVGFVAGAVVMLFTFRFSVILGSLGFLVMLVSTLVSAQHLRQTSSSQSASSRRLRARPHTGDWSDVRRRMRSRFGNHD